MKRRIDVEQSIRNIIDSKKSKIDFNSVLQTTKINNRTEKEIEFIYDFIMKNFPLIKNCKQNVDEDILKKLCQVLFCNFLYFFNKNSRIFL